MPSAERKRRREERKAAKLKAEEDGVDWKADEWSAVKDGDGGGGCPYAVTGYMTAGAAAVGANGSFDFGVSGTWTCIRGAGHDKRGKNEGHVFVVLPDEQRKLSHESMKIPDDAIGHDPERKRYHKEDRRGRRGRDRT